MDFGGMQCHGCGSSNVTFDAKRRIVKCNQCGKEEYYSGATLNANGKVLYSKQNAIRFFKEGKYDNANTFAREVLNISMDNAAALFVMSYYEEFIERRSRSMDAFFMQIADVPLEYDEVQELQELILACAINMMEYEEQIIQLIALNMQSSEDAKDLCEFIDKICPYFISKRSNMNFFTPNLVDMYAELAEHCGVPKTCFALMKAIDTNPDSPYAANDFHLKAKAKYFYEHFVLPLGKIIEAMDNAELRNKFLVSYQKKKEKYAQDAGF